MDKADIVWSYFFHPYGRWLTSISTAPPSPFSFPFSMNENLIIGIILFTCPHYTLPEQHDMPARMMDKVHKIKKKMSQLERDDRMAILNDEHMAGARICSTKFGKCFFPMKFPKKNKIIQRRKEM